MKYWNELRTGLVVARRGTVSAAATELGVHRATVNRHVEILEEALGAKLFQRTSKGYILTDEGREMLEVAKQADEMFSGLEGRT
ncbi:MAG: LysR family transcriptional regulator, partial [Pseudomonadota bacterium]